MIIRKRLGDTLIDAGLITGEQLKQALIEQKKKGGKLGKILVDSNVLSEDQLLEGLSQQLDLSRYSPDKYPLDLTLVTVLSSTLSRQTQVVPLRRERDMLLVAMPDPTDIDALEQLERETGMEAEPVICTETELGQLMSALYGATGEFNELLEAIETPEFAGDQDEEGVHDVQPDALEDMASGAPIVRMVNWIISQGVHLRASDIHLSPEKEFIQLRFRIDGQLRDMPSPPRSMFLPIVSRIKLLAHMDIAMSRTPQDGRFTVRLNGRDFNLRASTVPTVHGENVVLRVLDSGSGPKTLDALGFLDSDRAVVERLIRRPWGMVLACGPTGSGKTTTLYTLLQTLNRPGVNIMTLEDPAEYRLPRIRQVQINHRAGMTFAQGLRAMLRQDPDVIMVGEIRDDETARIAVQAALTGHLVLSTIHTNDAAGAVTRLVEMGVPPFLVSSVMLMAISQRLVRLVCKDCASAVDKPGEEFLKWLSISGEGPEEYRRGKGCNICMDTGYLGRLGIYEVLTFDEELRALIGSGASAVDLRRLAIKRNCLSSLSHDAGMKVRLGLTTAEEASSAVMF